MIGGKSASRTAPTALGTLVQASTYGLAIPNIYGLAKVSLLAIWAQNNRVGGSGKKFKNKKKGITAYVENVDFVLGNNPILGLMQLWYNNTKAPLNFTSVTGIFPGGAIPATYTISDSQFYAVVGVTWSATFSETFNDYGNPNGSQSVSGTFEIPLWNIMFNGPDPSLASGTRYYPYIYKWEPSDGAVVTFPVSGLGDVPANVTGANIYYAQKSAAISHETPIAMLRLTFEPTLADGPEYSTDGSFTAQQVLMPAYAGCGSPNFDLGSSGALPQLQSEVQGSFGTYSTGDADFSDMIEDVIKSGISEVSPADANATTAITPVQRGASCFDYPAPVQSNYLTFVQGLGNPSHLAFNLPNTPGNILFCWWSGTQTGTPTGITSDSAEAWHIIDSGTDGDYAWICAYAISNGYAAGNRVFPQVASDYGYHNVFYIAELPLDTFDTSVAATVTASRTNGTTLTTGNSSGQPAYVMGFVTDAGAVFPDSYDPLWNHLWQPDVYSIGQTRTLWAPQTINLNDYFTGTVNKRIILVSFKQVAPSTIPQPFGQLVDNTSMQICRNQARAYGLWGSYALTSQRSARDICKDLYESMNSAPFYSGKFLKQAPYGEASVAANGAVYVAPTASGPIANLSDLNGDFLGDKDTPPVDVDRTAQFDEPGIVRLTIPNRASDYNPVTVNQPLAGSVALYGVRFDTGTDKNPTPEVRNEISTTAVAIAVASIKARRVGLIRNTLSFSLGPKYVLYEPMDLVTVTETLSALSDYPARFTSLEIGADWKVKCEAEPFIYGASVPVSITTPNLDPYVPSTTADPGAVNTPIIFEPVPRLFGQQNQPQLWAVISAASPNYGGCVAYVSTDGGSSYNPIQNLASGNSSILGNGVTGVSTGDWPIHADPDTANSLPLDLSESLGSLSSYTAADRDNFTYPCWIDGGSTGIPYGLMTYNSAVLTAANKYTLAASGTGNELRRCVFGAPVTPPGPDVDHPNGSRFAFLGNPSQPNPPGLLKLAMDPKWIGVTLYFKFLPFNTFGNTIASLSTVTAYSFIPTGIPGSLQTPSGNSYIQSPAIALTQPSGTQISMAQVTETFGGNGVNYNARNFTITNPSVPMTYYVTIADSGQIGDTGALTNLTATCQTSDALVGVPGNTFIGLIVAVPGGGAGAIAGPGGWPEPQSAIVTS